MLDREKVGRAISAQRKVKGMTQRQLAEILHVSYQAVSRWELGLSMPSVDIIHDIAQSLETTVDWLLNGPEGERKEISYMETGLDTKKLYLLKDRLGSLVSRDDALLHAKYMDPVLFKPYMAGMEEPILAFANHVPGSKERFAMENGYDREICMDLVANAANNLVCSGVKPAVLQASMVCGDNDSGQILIMAEAIKESCEKDGIIYAGMEVSAQPVNYHPGEYKINALIMGVADRKKALISNQIQAGDVLIGLLSEGISAVSYPIVKVILDRRPEVAHAKVNGHSSFIDEMMKPNDSYARVMNELNDLGLIHGAFNIQNSLFARKSYRKMPKGLGACIAVQKIPIPPLLKYIYDLNMMDMDCFLQRFSLGIGVVLAVPETQCERVVKIIEKHNKCCVMGEIVGDGEHPDEKVWR